MLTSLCLLLCVYHYLCLCLSLTVYRSQREKGSLLAFEDGVANPYGIAGAQVSDCMDAEGRWRRESVCVVVIIS